MKQENDEYTVDPAKIRMAQERRAKIKEMGLEPLARFGRKSVEFWRYREKEEVSLRGTALYFRLLTEWMKNKCENFDFNLMEMSGVAGWIDKGYENELALLANAKLVTDFYYKNREKGLVRVFIR